MRAGRVVAHPDVDLPGAVSFCRGIFIRRRFLRERRFARLATASQDGKPSVVPICYALLEREDGLLIVSALDAKPKRVAPADLRRVRNIQANPAVSLVFAARGDLAFGSVASYVAAQIAGGVIGVMAAHVMFALPLVEFSGKVRTGGAQWFAEAIATFGLLATILGAIRFDKAAVPWLVGLYITAAYWFTASTSFEIGRAHV